MSIRKYFIYEDSDNKDNEKVKHIYKKLYKNVRIPWLRIIMGAIFGAFNSLVIFGAASEYMEIVNGTLTSLSPLYKYLAFALLQYVFVVLCVISDRALIGLCTSVRKKMWTKMMSVSTRDFEKMGPNSLLSRITSDSDYASKPFDAALGICSLIVALLSMGAVVPGDARYAYFGIAIVFILGVIVVVITAKVLSKSTNALQNKISKLTNNYTELFSNYRFIKASNAEEKVIDKSNELIEERYKAQLYQAVYKGLYQLCNKYSLVLMYVAVLLCGIIGIASNQVTQIAPIKAMYSFCVALEVTIGSIMLMPLYFFATSGASKKLVTVFDYENEDKTSGTNLEDVNEDINLKDVTFAYNDKNVINGVSVSIKKNKVTAIVGLNGSGKSTLVKLVSRLYPKSDGEIALGENSDNDVSLESWRKQFALVPQNHLLFSGSLKDNICYGISDVSDEKLNKVIKASCLEDVVKERGLDYDIGVRGSKLSGGQAQRVAIARALMKDSPYLILDEVTSNLDTKTEALIKKGYRELMKNRTTIIIAHDYSAIEDADEVIVLNDGKIEVSGTKQDVMNNSDFLKAMANIN